MCMSTVGGCEEDEKSKDQLLQDENAQLKAENKRLQDLNEIFQTALKSQKLILKKTLEILDALGVK